MASQARVVDGLVGKQKISVSNGRLPPAEGEEAAAASGKMVPGWSLAQNGFCLLTEQPMPVNQAVFDELPGQMMHSSPILFRLRGSEAEQVASDGAAVSAHGSPYTLYYKHIAEAAKVALPEAEYVMIAGHITFSAEEAEPESKGAEKTTPAVPAFGATQFLHVDISAEQGAERFGQSINAAETSGPGSVKSAAQRLLRLPAEFLSSDSKQRRVVTVNMWRNLRAEASIKSDHLAVMDARSVTEEELRAAKFKNYAIGGQEQYHISQLQDKHRLVYFPDMVQSEILCFKQGAYDVRAAPGTAAGQYTVEPAAEPHTNYIFHTSFVDPTAPSDALPRKSVVCAGVTVIMPETETETRQS